jgi:hypothetical protein
MSKRATRSGASTSKSASFVAASPSVPKRAKKQKTVEQAVAEDPEPEESEDDKMESGDDSRDPPYKEEEESSEESDSTNSADNFLNQKTASPVNVKTPSRSSGSSSRKKASSGKKTSSAIQGPRIGVQIQSPPEKYAHYICEGKEMCT